MDHTCTLLLLAILKIHQKLVAKVSSYYGKQVILLSVGMHSREEVQMFDKEAGFWS